MPMDRKTIGHLEQLARIELTPEERERLAGELGRIIDYASELQVAGTEGSPAAGAADNGGGQGETPERIRGGTADSGLRPDVPGQCLDRDGVLSEAPDTDKRKDFFRVPRAIPE